MPRQKALTLNSFMAPVDQGSLGLQHKVIDARVVDDLLATNLNEHTDPMEFFPQASRSPQADFQKILDILTHNRVYSDKRWRLDRIEVVDTVGRYVVDPSDEQKTSTLFTEVFKAAAEINLGWQNSWSAYGWRSHAESLIQGLRKPDVVLVSKHLQHQHRITFGDVKAYCEVKKHNDSKAIKAARLQLAEVAGLVTASQVDRRFFIGLSLCGTLLQVGLYVRGAIVYSRPLDIDQDPLQFIKILLNLSCVDPRSHGFDENFLPTGHQGGFHLRVGDLRVSVTSVKLFHAISIRGRGTKVSLCSRFEPETAGKKRNYVLKDSWLPEGTTDIDIHNHLASRPPNPFTDKEEESIFGSDDVFNIFRDCVQTTSVWDDTTNLPGIPIIAASEIPNCHNPSHTISSSQDGISDAARADTTQNILSRFTTNLSYEPRFHIRVLSETCGTSLAWFSCRRELINGLMCAIAGELAGNTFNEDKSSTSTGHFNGTRKNVLHSDISDTNVWFMVPSLDVKDVIPDWPQDGTYTKRAGVLGDWGLAEIREGGQHDNPAGTVTGTYPYLAMELLSDRGMRGEVRHEVRHDLESFFWLLWITCVNLNGPYLKRRVWNPAHRNNTRPSTKSAFPSQDVVHPTPSHGQASDAIIRNPADAAGFDFGVPSWATPGVHGWSPQAVYLWKRDIQAGAFIGSLSPYFSSGPAGEPIKHGLKRLRDYFVSSDEPKEIITHKIFIQILQKMRDAIPVGEDCPTEKDIELGRRLYESLRESGRDFDVPVMQETCASLTSQSLATSKTSVSRAKSSRPMTEEPEDIAPNTSRRSSHAKRRCTQTDTVGVRSKSKRRVARARAA